MGGIGNKSGYSAIVLYGLSALFDHIEESQQFIEGDKFGYCDRCDTAFMKIFGDLDNIILRFFNPFTVQEKSILRNTELDESCGIEPFFEIDLETPYGIRANGMIERVEHTVLDSDLKRFDDHFKKAEIF